MSKVHETLWDYSAIDIDGAMMDLAQFKGNVALVVNTATYVEEKRMLPLNPPLPLLCIC